LKPKLNYATGRKPHEGFSEDEVNSRFPNIPQDPPDYKRKKNGEARRSSMVSTNPKTRGNRSLTTGRHTVGDAPPHEAPTDQDQDDPEECS
jgi:hypothetical protein